MSTLKGAGGVHQQTFAKLYANKTPMTLADRVLPYFAEQDVPVLRILTDRGTERCGKVKRHDYQLYLVVTDTEHTQTRVPPQTNGICERLHKAVLQEFYQVTLRSNLSRNIEDVQSDLTPGLH